MISEQCKKCRRMGQKLFLKGERCYTPKCALVRRAYAPGARGNKKRRRELSEYGKQLLEKQKLRNIYGILERQFKNYVLKSMRVKGDNRENLMSNLETRLDNVIFRMGLAKSRIAARQIVGHGHIMVNGKKISIPSYQVRVGDVVAIREKSRQLALFNDLTNSIKKHVAPAWIILDKEKIEGKINTQPTVDDFGDLSGVGMVIEYYSR